MAANDLSIRLSVKDAETVRAVLRSVGDEGKSALAVLEVAGDKATVSARSLSRQLDTLRASIDPATAAHKQMASAQELLNQAMARGAEQGGITADEYARLSTAVTERFRAASGEVKAFGDTLTAAAQAAQANYDRLLGVTKSPTVSAASSAAVFEQVYAARQQQDSESSQLAYNRLLGVGTASAGSAAASAAVFENAARDAAAIEQLRARLDPAAASAKAMSQEVSALDGWLAEGKISAAEHSSALALVEQAYQKGGISAGQMTTASRMVTANLVNVANVAVATRGDLLMMLSPVPDIIMGLKDMGVGGAAAGSGLLAAGAAAAALVLPIVAIGAASAVHSGNVRELTVAIKAAGSSAGLTRTQLETSAQAMQNGAGTTVSGLRSIEAAVIRTGTVSGDAFKALIGDIDDVAALMGKEAPAAAQDLAEAMRHPYDAARKLDEQFNFLSAGELDHIRTLDQSGEKMEAAALLLDKLNGKAKGLAEEGLSGVTKAWRQFVNGFSNSWDKLGSLGEPQSLDRQIAFFQGALKENPQDAIYRKKLSELVQQRAQQQAQAVTDAALSEGRKQVKDAVTLGESVDPLSLQRKTLANQLDLVGGAREFANQNMQGPLLPGQSFGSGFDRTVEILQGQIKGLLDPSQMASRQVGIERQLASLPVNQRDRARAVAEGSLEAQSMPLDEAGRAAYAGAKGQLLGFQQQIQATDQIAKLRDETQAADALAAAWGRGTKAAQDQDAANQAHQAWLSNIAVDEGRLKQSILDRSAAQVLAAAGQQNTDLERQVQGLEAVAAAEQQSGTAAREVSRQQEVATLATKLRTAAELSGSQERMAQAETEVARYDDLTKRRDQAEILRSAAQLNRQYDGDKAYADEIARLQELADTGVLTAKTLKESFEDADLARLRSSKDATDGAILALKEYAREASNDAAGTYRAMSNGARGVDNFFATVATGSKSGADAFRSFTDSVISDLMRMMSQKFITGPLANALGGAMSGGGGLFDWLFGGSSGGSMVGDFPVSSGGATALAANGMAFEAGGIRAFANGGAFTNRIFDSPTLFRFGSGGTSLGVMGEAGEEAVMPLTRGPGGKLGVQAVGGGVAVNIPVTVNIETPAGTQTKTTQRRDSGGGLTLDVIVEQITDAMSGDIAKGQGIAPVLEHQYGLNRAAGAYR